MRILTVEEMAGFDRHCIEQHRIPSLFLMEHAGLLTARAVQGLLDRRTGCGCGGHGGNHAAPTAPARGRRVLVLAGSGNNGGDGFVAARHLSRWGHDVRVLCLKDPAALQGDAAVNAWLLKAVTGVVPEVLTADDLPGLAVDVDAVVDALFGTGLCGDLAGLALEVVLDLNSSRAPVVAVDVPSGLSADTGLPLGAAVAARCTVTMGLPKLGFFSHEARCWLGELVVADIGFPRAELLTAGREPRDLVLAGDVASWLPPRDPSAHKGDFGRILVVGGSRGMAGAAALAARAALRAGAGLVRVAVPESSRAEVAAMAPEVMTAGLPERDGVVTREAAAQVSALLQGWDALLLGPGLGRGQGVRDFVAAVLGATSTPTVIDADGLHALAPQAAWGDRPVVLTPHEGEAAMLLGTTPQAVRQDRFGLGRRVAAQRNAVAMLKGAFTLVADPKGRLLVNPTGNVGMATAGSGDVLAGVVACFLAQRVEPLVAAALGAYVHGLAGDLAAEDVGERGLTAQDLIAALPGASQLLEDVEPADGPYPETLPQDRLTVAR